MSAPSVGPSRGFTLIELLVATFILAILGSMAYRGLSALQENERHVSREAKRWQDIGRAVDRIGRDLRQADERTGRDAGGGVLPAFRGRQPGQMPADAPLLSFSRAGGDGLDTRRIGLRWRAGTLELLLWPTPEAEGQVPQQYKLLEGVKAFQLAYLSASGVWHDAWPLPGSAPRPRAVRIRLALDEGEIERLFDLP